jgi:hypothetical protein
MSLDSLQVGLLGAACANSADRFLVAVIQRGHVSWLQGDRRLTTACCSSNASFIL